MDRPAHGIVDLHVHLFPPKMYEAVWDFFETRNWAVHHEYVEDVARTLTAHGVTLAAGLCYPHKTGVARSLNEFMESVGEKYPLFRPFATVHPDDADFREQVDYALASPHLHGFKFQPLVQMFDVNDARLDYLYERCQASSFPLIMHVGTAPVANEFVGVKHFRKLIKRYPDLRVCVAHMGGYEFNEFLYLMDEHPNVYLDTTMINVRTDLFDATWYGDEAALLRHADRICFGSDWPHVPYPYQEALDSLPRFPLPPKALVGVRGKNALCFLKENED